MESEGDETHGQRAVPEARSQEGTALGKEVISMTKPYQPNQIAAAAADEKAVAGVDKYLAGVTQVTLGKKPYTPAQLKAPLQAEIDVNKALDLAKAALRQQVADAQSVRADARAMRAALKQYILSAYGADAVQVFEDFGIPVPKPKGIKTAAVKAEAARKAKATRDAKKAALAKATQPAPAVQVSTTPPAK